MQHVHLIGASGQGKSNCMAHMAFHDVNEGHGAAVIDPRGEMVADLLRRLPSRHLDRIIYLNPGEPDWVPIWNPLTNALAAEIRARVTVGLPTIIERRQTRWLAWAGAFPVSCFWPPSY
jgi:hypothetical protein